MAASSDEALMIPIKTLRIKLLIGLMPLLAILVGVGLWIRFQISLWNIRKCPCHSRRWAASGRCHFGSIAFQCRASGTWWIRDPTRGPIRLYWAFPAWKIVPEWPSGAGPRSRNFQTALLAVRKMDGPVLPMIPKF